MKINGVKMPWREGQSVGELLQEQGYSQQRIAVERNGDILPKTQYQSTLVEKEDVFEVVNFVGGG